MSDIALLDKEVQEVRGRIPKTIATPEEYQAGTDLLKVIKSLIKTIEENFADSIEAAHKAHKAVLAQRDGHLKPLKEDEAALKKIVSAFIQEQERIAEEKRKLEEQRVKKDAEVLASFGLEDEASEILSTPVPQEKVQTNGITYRGTWKFEILDSAQIPREFLSPDEVKIGQYVRAMKEGASIPGVKIWCEKTASVRV